MKFTIFHVYRTLPSPARLLASTGGKITRREDCAGLRSVNVVLCSSRYIRSLNQAFRRKDRVTDVLSFNYGDPEMASEIYISLQRAKTQARQFGHSYEKEVIRLFIHGMFHLLGYDHQTIAERDKMELRESRYWGL
jgi:probable rRNA maturation factor